MLTYEPRTQRVVLFGGVTCPRPAPDQMLGCAYSQHSQVLSDTWTWDGSNWREIATAHAPSVQLGAYRGKVGMGTDPVHRQTLLVAGGTNPTTLIRTWIFEGADWSLADAGQDLPANEFSGPAYDHSRDRLLLWINGGGLAGSRPGASSLPYARASETWRWIGTSWKREDVRLGAGDVLTDQLKESDTGVMAFGGGAGPVLVEGSRSRTLKKSPLFGLRDQRTDWAGAYDASTGQLIIFGGRYGNYLFGDTIAWASGSWRQLLRGPVPPGRPLPQCSAAEAYGGVGGPGVEGVRIDFIEPPRGPCHLAVKLVVTLSAGDVSPMAVPGNPAHVDLDVALSDPFRHYAVLLPVSGLCFKLGVDYRWRAVGGSFDESGDILVPPTCAGQPRVGPVSTRWFNA